MDGSAMMESLGRDATPDLLTGAGRLTVDLSALRRNYRRLKRMAPGASVAGIVKADAYGLGAGPVSRALYAEGCRSFFVAQLVEALRLRAELPGDAEILVLNGLLPGAEALAQQAGVTPVLNSLPQIAAWSALACRLGERLPAAIQLDSGMSRFGLAPDEVSELLRRPEALHGIEPTLVMSHLACADTPDAAANAEQLAEFRRLATHFTAARRSLANSAATLAGPDFRFDLVRPGIALYGGAPVAGLPNPMEAVVTVEAPVAQIRTVPAGTGIGYGHSRRAEAPMRLATLPVGYADGWLRSQSDRGAAAYAGRILPFVGRVSMDSIILDAGAAPELRPGMLVELIGPDRTLDQVAHDAGTISYEILTSLGARFQRRHIDREGSAA